MQFKFGYVDESGQTGFSKKSSRHLILASILFKDRFTGSRVAKEIFRKFRLGEKKKNRIHTSDENEKLKIKMLAELRKHDYKITYVSIKKKETGKDYYFEALDMLLKKMESTKLDSCVISQLHTSKQLVKKVKEVIEQNKVPVELDLLNQDKNLQVADFINWCIYQKYEFGRSEYYELLFQK